MRTISTTTDLDVDVDVAWDVLTDLPTIGTWNPFIRRIDGELAPGARLRVELSPPGGRPMTFRPRVTATEPGRCLEWLGSVGVRGLFDGRHRFELEPLAGGRARLRHAETFTGALVPLAWRSMAAPTTAGFEAFNAAFAARCREVAAA